MDGDVRSSSSEISDSSESAKSVTNATNNGTPLKKPVPKPRSSTNSPKHSQKE